MESERTHFWIVVPGASDVHAIAMHVPSGVFWNVINRHDERCAAFTHRESPSIVWRPVEQWGAA